MTDVIIVGAGVTGCAIARELSRYSCSVLVLERAWDVCEGTSKANSGIVHAGFDAVPGSWKARLNLEGSRKMEALSKELDFPYRRNGSLVLCFCQEDRQALTRLYEQGLRNGVEGLEILEGEEVRKLEPNVSEKVVAALHAPSGAIVCPFGLTIALAENAVENGVEFRLGTEVEKIEPVEGGYRLTTAKKDLQTLADFNGLQIRTMENQNHMAFWTAIGAQPTPMAWNEVYFALQSGNIAAQENAADTCVGNNLNEVQDYLAFTNHILYANMMIMNQEAYDSLDPLYQEALGQAVTEAMAEIGAQLATIDADNKAELESRGMTLIEYAPEFYDEVLAVPGVVDLYKSINEQIGGLGDTLQEALTNA